MPLLSPMRLGWLSLVSRAFIFAKWPAGLFRFCYRVNNPQDRAQTPHWYFFVPESLHSQTGLFRTILCGHLLSPLVCPPTSMGRQEFWPPPRWYDASGRRWLRHWLDTQLTICNGFRNFPSGIFCPVSRGSLPLTWPEMGWEWLCQSLHRQILLFLCRYGLACINKIKTLFPKGPLSEDKSQRWMRFPSPPISE